MATTYADRLKSAHDRIRVKFGTDTADAQIYVWHNGAQITAYEANRQRARNIAEAVLMDDAQYIVHATKDEFTTEPKPGDSIKLGTTLASAITVRIDDVMTTHVRPFYRISANDPQKATTAA